jgi:hypothetical protein
MSYGGGARDNNLNLSNNTFTRKSGKSAGRSKSPGVSQFYNEEVPERGSAVKLGEAESPAWYKALKKNIK